MSEEEQLLRAEVRLKLQTCSRLLDRILELSETVNWDIFDSIADISVLVQMAHRKLLENAPE